MLIFVLILFIVSCILLTIAIYKGRHIYEINTDIEEQNKRLKEQNKELDAQNYRLDRIRLELEYKVGYLKEEERRLAAAALEDAAKHQQIMTESLEQYCKTLETAYCSEENKFDLKCAALTKAYEDLQDKLSGEYEQDKELTRIAFETYMENLLAEYSKAEAKYDVDLANLTKEIALRTEELDKIAATWKAAREAQIREEELRLQTDFYCLHLSETDTSTIRLIEDLKPRLPEPRVLSMLIWTTYFQKQATALCNNILGTQPVCGIYKITNLKTGLCYIGQAVNIADRWKQHIKCGLGIDTPVKNKLYQAMFKDGITNFTFELLEQCERNLLNEKEKFYIGLYQSCDYGYNSNAGHK